MGVKNHETGVRNSRIGVANLKDGVGNIKTLKGKRTMSIIKAMLNTIQSKRIEK
jgi:hypothetical protein